MSNKAQMQEIERLREFKRRSIPVKCVYHSYLHLAEGDVGLCSPEEWQFGRPYLKQVTVKDFDAKNYPGYGKPTKKKVKEVTNES